MLASFFLQFNEFVYNFNLVTIQQFNFYFSNDKINWNLSYRLIISSYNSSPNFLQWTKFLPAFLTQPLVSSSPQYKINNPENITKQIFHATDSKIWATCGSFYTPKTTLLRSDLCPSIKFYVRNCSKYEIYTDCGSATNNNKLFTSI